jgi:hypothetical protein
MDVVFTSNIEERVCNELHTLRQIIRGRGDVVEWVIPALALGARGWGKSCSRGRVSEKKWAKYFRPYLDGGKKYDIIKIRVEWLALEF